MNKVQLTLTKEENELLSFKAASLGYDVTKYIKFLISREAFAVADSIPTYPLSAKAEKEVLKALEEHKKGKSIRLDDVEDLDRL